VCLLLAAAYAVFDYAVNKIGFTSGWTILWPLNGLSIAILLILPRSDWPPVLLGIAVGTGIGECFDSNPLALELWMRPNSILEVFLSALVLPPFLNLDQWLRELHLLRRFALALAIGPGISGIIFAVVFHFARHLPYVEAFFDWAASDALGIAVMVPLVLSVRSTEMRDLFRPRNLFRTLCALTLALAAIALSLANDQYQLLFLLYPTLLAVDLVLSFAGSSIAATSACFLAILLAIHGQGPFGHWNSSHMISRDQALQAFLAFQILAVFPVSIVLRERRRLTEDLNSSNEQLLRLASRDGLTGLFNRRSFDNQLHQEWKRAIRTKSSLALLMIDVDLFKQFNDRYGQRSGDECLRIVAQTIALQTHRAQDHLARYRGEEFVLILPHTDLPGALYLAEHIRTAIYDLALNHEASPWNRITLSLGCASIKPTLSLQLESLLHASGSALYEANRAGGNAIRSADAEAYLLLRIASRAAVGQQRGIGLQN
jgi:diguanylate cyclase (GGDEF)-like protein